MCPCEGKDFPQRKHFNSFSLVIFCTARFICLEHMSLRNWRQYDGSAGFRFACRPWDVCLQSVGRQFADSAKFDVDTNLIIWQIREATNKLMSDFLDVLMSYYSQNWKLQKMLTTKLKTAEDVVVCVVGLFILKRTQQCIHRVKHTEDKGRDRSCVVSPRVKSTSDKKKRTCLFGKPSAIQFQGNYINWKHDDCNCQDQQ